MKYLAFILFLFISLPVFGLDDLSLELNHANLKEAIRLVAVSMHLNIIMSTAISGTINLHIQHGNAQDTLDMLLATHGLARIAKQHIWYIAPRDEIAQWQTTQTQQKKLRSFMWQVHYTRAQDFASFIKKSLSTRGQLHVDDRTNIIYIEDSDERIKEIDSTLRKLDVPVPQVEIAVRLASVDVDYEQELGFSFSTHTAIQSEAEGVPHKTAHTGQYSVAVVRLADQTLLDVKLSALENTGRAELISSPRLFTSNLQTSAIEAGEEVPYQAQSESGGTAVEFKKAVLGFKVTPQILPNQHVMLAIQINQDRPSNKMVLGMPTISTRQITSNVLAKSGQTIVLGGIYEINNEIGEQGLPYISHLPVVGRLLTQHNNRKAKRELLIFVTPKIL